MLKGFATVRGTAVPQHGNDTDSFFEAITDGDDFDRIRRPKISGSMMALPKSTATYMMEYF